MLRVRQMARQVAARVEYERLLRVDRHWLMVFAYRAYAETNEGTFYAGG
jgi:hypothetical protein